MRGTKVARLSPGVAMLLTMACLSAGNLRGNAQPAFVPPANVSITNSTATVFDLTGNYQFVQQAAFSDGSVSSLTLNFALFQNAAGFLRTNGQTNILIGSNSVPATFKVQGRVTGRQLAALLAPYGIAPVKVNTSGRCVQGYRADHIAQACGHLPAARGAA